MENENGTTKKPKRSEHLIANFRNGFAENWFMAVGEQFRNELDIKKTKRKKVAVWTQGQSYNFKEGQVFYDAPEGYSIWANALEKITFTCKILKSEAKIIGTKYNVAYEGFVKFVLYKTNQRKTDLIEIDKPTMSQDSFVVFLKTGEINNKKINFIYE